MESNPELVYHYTSFDSFFNIINNIENKEKVKLYLTHYQYLNDISEIEFAKRVIKDLFGMVVVGNKEAVNDAIELAFAENTVFLSSFCRRGNKLNQWRSYCPSGGISIGINKTKFSQENDYILDECIYNHEHLVKEFEKILLPITELAKNESQKTDDKILRLYIEMFNLILRCKHSAFDEEEEFRIVHLVSNEILEKVMKFRTSKNKIIPYIEIDFNASLIEELIIGPCSNPRILKRDIHILCKQKGISPEILLSGIPLRVFH